MTNRRRADLMTILIVLLLTTAALAGCAGDDADGGPLDAADADETDEPADGEDETSDANTTQPVFEEAVFTFEGSGTGLGTSVTGANFWAVGEDFANEADLPDRFDRGTIRFSWDGTVSVGGMLLWLQDETGGTVHIFEADASPLEVELDADDDRVAGAAGVTIIPDQGTPATVHVQVDWTAEFALMVPSDTGDAADA